jgi:hypothetical protein
LREAGLDAILKKPKPLLNQQNVKIDLNFVMLIKNWGADDWKRVAWTDKTKIHIFNLNGRTCWAWIRDGETVKPKRVEVAVKQWWRYYHVIKCHYLSKS